MRDDLGNEMRRIAEAATAKVGKTSHGIVSAVDPINHAVKVRVQPEDIESGWLPVSTLAAGALRICRVPDIGEHVRLEPIEGDAEHLCVSAAQFDTITTPPVSPATGTAAQPGEMLIMAGQKTPPADATSTTPGAATENAPWWHMTANALHAGAGNATVSITNGAITWAVGAVTMKLTSAGLAVVGAEITSDTDVLAAGISGKTHLHSGVEPGSGETGAPVA